jgi:hypothetical protein
MAGVDLPPLTCYNSLNRKALMSKRYPWIDDLSAPQAVALAGILIVACAGVLAFKAWLLVLVLGWFGITTLGFWKAVVAVVLLDLLLAAARR